jgi:hypothetical protein
VIDIDKFDYKDVSHAQFERNVQSMDWILSLDLSLSSPSKKSLILPLFLTDFFPNLREADFSNMNLPSMVLDLFSSECPLLEKITYCNNTHTLVTCHGNTLYRRIKSTIHMIRLSGFDMRCSYNLKQIYMDNFAFYDDHAEKDNMMDLNNYRDTFIFHCCCNVLERVSIRNAKWRDHPSKPHIINAVHQNALIKFARNAPSLRWFRSDLAPENMNMLRLERPGIEFY